MIEAGRKPRGEDAGARLTESQVIEIRVLAPTMGRGKYESLGRRYGVSGKQISHIVRGKRWAHLVATPADRRRVKRLARLLVADAITQAEAEARAVGR